MLLSPRCLACIRDCNSPLARLAERSAIWAASCANRASCARSCSAVCRSRSRISRPRASTVASLWRASTARCCSRSRISRTRSLASRVCSLDGEKGRKRSLNKVFFSRKVRGSGLLSARPYYFTLEVYERRVRAIAADGALACCRYFRGAHPPQYRCTMKAPLARLRPSQVLKRGVVASHGCRETTDDSAPTARAASVVVNHPDTARRWDLRGSTPESSSVTPTVVPSAGGALSCCSSCW